MIATAMLPMVAAPVAAVPTVVYFNDLEGGVVPAEWTGPLAIGTISPPGDCTSTNGFCDTQYLRVDQGTATLTLSGLGTDHAHLSLALDLFILDSWDGNGNFCCGPDRVTVEVDGVPVLDTTFSNTGSAGNSQSYPDTFLAADNPQQTGALEANTLGSCCDNHGNAVYRFPNVDDALVVEHSSDTATITILNGASQGCEDECLGIDNVEVTVDETGEAECGRIVANGDEWPLSDSGFGNAPDAAQYALNVASWFTDGAPGNFLVYATNFGLTGASLAGTMTGAGHTWTVDTGVSFDAATLSAFDGIFVAGHVAGAYPDNSVLVEYVNEGGNVYVAGGTGNGGSAGEAAGWNTLLNAFGLNFVGAYNGVGGNVAASSAHPVLTGVSSLFYGNANTVTELNPADPNTDIIQDLDGVGLIGVAQAETCDTVPPPPPPPVEQPQLPCPHSQGFWKNHPDAWPINEIQLGNTAFTQDEFIEVFQTPPKGDARIILAHQEGAAKLNLAMGAFDVEVDELGTLVSAIIGQADTAFVNNGGTLFDKADKVPPSSVEGNEMVELAGILDDFNNGVFTLGCGEVGVTKTSNGAAAPGQDAVFTIVVTNHGPGPATGVTLDDTLPAGTWNVGEAPDENACPDQATGAFSCSFGTLDAGETRTLTVSRVVDETECGAMLVNSATVATTGEDDDASNDTASASVEVVCE